MNGDGLKIVNVTQEVRPLKICFLIDGTKNKSLAEAITYSSMLWGGINNIIIPIWNSKEDKSRKKHYLDLLKTTRPDYIVNLTNRKIPKDFLLIIDNNFILSKKDFVSIKNKDYIFSLGIRLFPVLNSFLNEIDKNKIGKTNNISFMGFNGIPEDNLGIIINCGYLGNSSLGETLKLQNNTLFGNLTEYLNNFGLKYSNLDIGYYSIKSYGNFGAFRGDFLYFGNKNNIDDLIEFWNIRACGRNGFYIGVENISKYKKIINNFIDNHYYKINEYGYYNMTSILKGKSIKDGVLSKIIENIIIKKNNGKFIIQNWIPGWGESNHKMVMKQIICPNFYHKSSKHDIIFNNGFSQPLVFDKPSFLTSEIEYRYKKPYFAINLAFYDNSLGQNTINTPIDVSLFDFIKYRIFNGEDLIRIGRNISIFIDNGKENLYINQVDKQDIFKEYFKFYGIDINYSSPGIISEKIIEHLGGNIDNCRILKLKGVRDLLREMSTVLGNNEEERSKSHKIIKEGLNIHGIANKIKKIHSSKEDFHGILKYDKYKQNEEGVIKYLYEKNIIRPGMLFICSNCQKKEWYSIEEFSKTYQCRYCFKEQQVTLFTNKNEEKWYYKPDGLFILPDGGQGSIATIISLWFLNHFNFMGNSKFIYSSSINCILNDGKTYECDFVGFIGNDLILGEAKNYTELTKKDFTKMIELGNIFKKKPILCFSTLKDSFTDSEKKMILNTQKKGFIILPLTRNELDPYDIFHRLEGHRNKYTRNIYELSEILFELNIDKK